jgi:hypothetical protein
MKTKYLFLVGLVVAFSSCSTAYRTGQTPDDVYYSPAPAQDTYVKTVSQDDRESYGYRNAEEQDIRRGIRDQRYRNSITFGIGSGYSPYAYNPYVYNPYSFNNPYAFDPYGYKGIYDPYGYNPYYSPYGYNPYYSPYYGGSYYGGYYGGGYYSPVYVLPVIGKVNTNTGPRKYNLGAYNNPAVSNNETIRTTNGTKVSGVKTSPVRTFKPTNQGTGVGNVLRRVFTPSENNSYTAPKSNNRTYRSSDNDRPAYTPPTRTFNNAPSSNNTSTPSSSGSSGSAPVRTFRK